MFKIKMNLENPNIGLARNLNNYSNIVNQSNNVFSQPQSASLNSPMIGRIYKARPGCSACGKKVA